MSKQHLISDLHYFPLSRQDGRLGILRAEDHLLRRFGLLEILDLKPEHQTAFNLRAEADEIWAPLSGTVEATLVDQRPNSPSRGQRLQFTLDAEDPYGLLIPFGVAHAFVASGQARLLRLSTHSETHPRDRQGPAADLGAPSPAGAKR